MGTPDSHTARGFSLLQAGDRRRAQIAFHDAIRHDAQDVRAWLGLGIVAHRGGDYPAALEMFGRVLAIDANHAAALANRGNTLLAMGRVEESIASLRRALACDATTVGAWVNLGTALHAKGDLDAAVEALEKARQLQPHNSEVLNNLGNLYKDQGRLADALAAYDGALEANPLAAQPFSNRLSALKLDVRRSPREVAEEHMRWASVFAGARGEAPLLSNTPDPERRLRIGYVSPDCHIALPAFIDATIAAHDRGTFDVYCYFNHPQPASKLQALKVEARARVMRGLDDRAVAAMVHADAIDILIDIAGHTGHNRLGVFARRPAPVQITWLDYLCTTGVAEMDFRLTDGVADPPGNEAFHSERLLRLPNGQWCWTAPADAPDVGPLPCLRNGRVTFGSFNHVQKLTDATLELWSALLHALPGARMLLAGVPPGLARVRVVERLACGAERLEFLERLPPQAYRAAIGRADLALDALPFSGATTTLDALYQGVPVLTLPGRSSCSRSTASLLTTLGRQEWIARDRDDFVARAVALAGNVDALAGVRASLRAALAASPLTDRQRFVGDLESALREAWRDWCERGAADRARHAAIARAKAEVERGAAPAAMEAVVSVLRERPYWELPKRLLAHAGLGWARANPDAEPPWHAPPPAVPRTLVSAIVCSIRPDYFAAVSQALHAQFAQHELELIGIHDARSLCEAYNRGAASARGEVLVFCHDDIAFLHADFGARVLAHLQHFDGLGVAGADRLVNGDWTAAGAPHLFGQVVHQPRAGESGFVLYVAGLHGAKGASHAPCAPVAALDGVFMAVRRGVWERIRFDEATFDGFHLYDIDFTFRAQRAGFKFAVASDLRLCHFSSGRYDARWHGYNRRFLAKFPQLSNCLPADRHSPLNVKLQTLEQVERLLTALFHCRFGARETQSAATSPTQNLDS